MDKDLDLLINCCFTKAFSLKPDLILDLGFKKLIADTKYKLVYSKDSDPKCGISQSDLYQIVSYAIRFSINEVKLLYPTNMANTLLGDFNITIKDTLADGEEIEVSAYQLPVIDVNLTSTEIKSNQNFIESFVKLKNVLIKKLEKILKAR
ncbi:hypothetical protein HZP85_06035 [Elizabethkingia anophelis]|nr:hypothetical protein [Elizabethkingia anophelis]